MRGLRFICCAMAGSDSRTLFDGLYSQPLYFTAELLDSQPLAQLPKPDHMEVGTSSNNMGGSENRGP